MLHHQHPCSPVRQGGDYFPFSWHRSRALEREQQLAARLFFRQRPVLQTNISVPVTINRPLYGFVVQVTLGTPATTQTMLIDSAATYSWVQCVACAGSESGCFRQDDPLFNPGASTTYRGLPCSSQYCLPATGNPDAPTLCALQDDTCIYAIDYLDESSSVGRVGTDKLTFGQETFPGFIFGCSQGYYGKFGRYSGILSFGPAKMSFFSQVVERTRQYRAISSYLPSSSSVGYIQVGAYDEDGLAFTPMFTNGTDYYFALTGITVDGCPLDMPSWRFSPNTAVAIAAC
ncbi:hypothetical protein QOZ80_1AG0020110 [Eleusine coracana subsp. coracana]|nr:hypothetical protein QOZ80_1AG0020110 [Eleusine coracana subsp. coracana]